MQSIKKTAGCYGVIIIVFLLGVSMGYGVTQKLSAATTTYTIYGTAYSEMQTDEMPNSSSFKCLSCHDGVRSEKMICAGIKARPEVNLAEDHPVSVEYIEGRSSLKPVNTRISGWIGGAQTIGDLLRNGKIECDSCHVQHKSPEGEGVEPPFLRIIDRSRLCQTCHKK